MPAAKADGEDLMLLSYAHRRSPPTRCNAVPTRAKASLWPLSLIGLALPVSALAQVRTGTMMVRASVNKDCQVQSEDLNFQTYDSAAAAQSDADVTVTCTPTTSATVSFSAGFSGNPQNRAMRNEGDATFTLPYKIYSDASRATEINTTGKAFEMTAAQNPNGAPKVFTVYGTIPAGQRVRPGNYTDQLTISVNF